MHNSIELHVLTKEFVDFIPDEFVLQKNEQRILVATRQQVTCVQVSHMKLARF